MSRYDIKLLLTASQEQVNVITCVVKRLRVRLFSQLQPLEAWRPSACRSGTCGARGFQLHPVDVTCARLLFQKRNGCDGSGRAQDKRPSCRRGAILHAWHGVVNAWNQLLLVDACVRIILTPRS